MNTKNKAIELRSSKHTTDPGALQKGEDFVKAFSLGFDVEDVGVWAEIPQKASVSSNYSLCH
jgi:hypothetical protein